MSTSREHPATLVARGQQHVLKPREPYTTMVHRFFNDVFIKGDHATAEEILRPDFAFYGPPEGIRGINAFIKFTRTIREALNIQFKIHVVIFEDETTLASLITMCGKHDEIVFHELPPKGASFELPRIDNFLLEEGQIKEVRATLDHEILLDCLAKGTQVLNCPMSTRS